MAIFKIEKCPACGKKLHVDKPQKVNRDCPKCGTPMRYSRKWSESFTHNGKLHIKAVSPDKRFTEDALSKARVAIRENRYFDKAAAIPWKRAVEEFKAWIENNTSPKTQRMYLNSLGILSPYLSGYTLDKITPQMIEHFKKERIASGVKNTTINRDLATIKRLFSLAETEWVTAEGQPYIEVNRIRKVKLLSEKENKRTRYLSEAEIDRLLWACRNPESYGNARKHMIVLLALETGQRKESVLSLERGDISFHTNTITFRVIKGGGKTIIVDMTDKLRESLREYLNGQKVVGRYLFPSEQVTGRQMVTLAPLRSDADFGFATALRHAGIEDFHFHDLRHTFATHFLYRTNGNWKALQYILGHESIAMTMNRYAHLMDEGRKEAMQQFGQGKQ